MGSICKSWLRRRHCYFFVFVAFKPASNGEGFQKEGGAVSAGLKKCERN